MDKEYRNIGVISNFDEESRKITGCAIKFDTESQYMGFYEKIDRSAVDMDLIARSDIFALLNHNGEQVLARSRFGQGSLSLELRDDGLYYEFEAPHTQVGDELIEHIKRGEIFASSFCFSLPLEEAGDKREYDDNGVLHRTITKIGALYDVSPVYEPAYLATSCSKRTLDILEEIKEKEKMEEEIRQQEEVKEQEEIREKEEEKPENDNDNTDDSPSSDDNDDKEDKVDDKADDKADDKVDDKEEEKEEEKEEKSFDKNDENQNIENKNIQKNNHNIMEKNFSLLRSVRAIVNNQKLNDIDAAVCKAGAEEFRKASVQYGGQIQLPNMLEQRGVISVNAEGEDVVATDIYDILTPLRAKNVLVQAGAKFMTGLVSNVQVPIMTASQVTWEGETASASDGAPAFSHVTLSPKRLTAYIDLSKQFLVQDSVGAEQVIRQDLVNAINSKLESTILGDAAGTTTQPEGLLHAVEAGAVSNFAGIVDAEADIEDANVYGDIKYIVSPKAKSAMRSMIKGTNATGMVYENNAVDGTPALSTTNMKTSYMVAGDWTNLAIGQWGAIDLTVDPYTKAADGQVRLVINAFFDAKVLRPEAFAASKIVSGD